MRLSLFTHQSKDVRRGKSIPDLSDLPGLCCQAAGGDPAWADDLALAWLLFYFAAGDMDGVQDQDEPDAWWLELGHGAALSAATGIYFSAALVISNLQEKIASHQAGIEIAHDFYQSLLSMSSGQYLELITPEPTLEQYWKFVEAKSGAFFSLACRNGARLASQEQPVIQAFSAYGMRLGLLIQILDDLEDFRMLQDPQPANAMEKIRRSLPVIYALEVSAPAQQEAMRALINSKRDDPETIEGLIMHLDQCGAALYMLAEIEKQRQMAVEALGGVQLAAEPAEKLINLAINL